jgi:hypothetical protein
MVQYGELKWEQGDQMIRKKICQIFKRIAQKVAKSKKGQIIYNEAQFENRIHLHETTFDTLKYLQQTMF